MKEKLEDKVNQEKRLSLIQRLRNSAGAICLTAATSLIAPSFGSGCVHHEIYSSEEEISDAQPPKPLPLPVNANILDGHYTVEIKNIKATYDGESIKEQETFYGNVDFRSFDSKKGTLMFGYDGVFCWVDPSIKIDDKGEFKAIIEPRPFYLLTNWFGCKLEIKEGKFNGDQIEAEVIETQYAGSEKNNLIPMLVLEYKLTGEKRFELKKTPAKLIEGEFKTLTTKFNNTCQFQTLPNGDYYFPITFIPQGKNSEGKTIMDINIEDILDLSELPIESDGTIKETTYKSGNDFYVISGKVDPNNLNLKIKLDFRFGEGKDCIQTYEMVGKKRLEEANGTEKTFDGIFSSLMSMKYNTCDNETYNGRRHFDILRVRGSSSKVVLKIGQIEFEFDVGKDGWINSQYEDTWYKFKADLYGHIKPNSMNLTLDLEQGATAYTPSCVLGYTIVGKKLNESLKKVIPK